MKKKMKNQKRKVGNKYENRQMRKRKNYTSKFDHGPWTFVQYFVLLYTTSQMIYRRHRLPGTAHPLRYHKFENV